MLRLVPSAVLFDFAEGAHRDDAGLRRDAEQPVARGDRARHGGAVRVRRLLGGERVELLGNLALQLGVPLVDLGIDHRDGDALAGGELVGLFELELADHVLRRVALAGGRGRLGQHEDVVRRHQRNELSGLQDRHRLAERQAGRQFEPGHAATERAERIKRDHADVERLEERPQLHRRIASPDSCINTLFGDEPRLAGRRHAARHEAVRAESLAGAAAA